MKRIWYPNNKGDITLFYNSNSILRPYTRKKHIRNVYGFPNALRGKLFDVRV
jgi:hypothetical protein